MTIDVPIRCRCGKLRGAALGIGPDAGTHLVCYCNDCQAFARFLGGDDILDSHGGTSIFHMAPAKLRLDDVETLRCVRLSEKGMYRWYCGSCKTPVGNTMGPRFPFIGLIHSILDHASTGRSREELLGKPLHFATKSAVGRVPEETSTARMMARSVRKIVKWWIAGGDTPFTDPRTRAPRVEPQVLTPSERQALRSSREASP
jgi:hypothetical protein